MRLQKNERVIIVVYAFILIFLAIPILSIVWSISNFINYKKAKNNHSNTDTFQNKESLRSLRTITVISFIVAFVLTAVVIGTIITFAIGIMYM